MIGVVRRQPITVGLGLAFGLTAGVLSYPAVQYAQEWFDSGNHVLTLTAHVEELSATEITLHVTGDKRRDCTYVRLQAYTVDDRGVKQDAFVTRVDQQEDHDSKPPGSYDFGVWRIWPRGVATSVQVYSDHICSGRATRAKVLDLKVPR
jgi:hypothetical protein